MGENKKLGNNFLDSKCNTVKRFKSGLHSFLDQKEIDYCINNDLDVGYLYDEMASKYGGDVDKPLKEYYKPNGNKRGRPKQQDNEQEQ